MLDDRNTRYTAEREEIKELLGDREFRAATRNTLNAHYTDASIVSAMWDALKGLGFKRGEVLEPGSGSGNFIGHAPDGARMTGVELDPTTAAISKYLYPDATIHNEGFQHSPFRDGSFDLVVGNVPFGNFKLRDLKYNPGRKDPIHDHFINRSLEHLKPAIGLETGGHRPFHLGRIEGVDVLIHHPHVLQAAVSPERRRDGSPAVVGTPLGDLDDRMQP